MAVKWTAEQQKVIDTRDRNLLVSAAAGSGKTAVLVERILAMVKDPVRPIDIDQLLVVTFTRAAAGEMKRESAAPCSRASRKIQRMSIYSGSRPCFTMHRSAQFTVSVRM